MGNAKKEQIRNQGYYADQYKNGSYISIYSLSPFIFNITMDKIVGDLPKRAGYKTGNTYFNVVCYADDTVLIADSEDDLQRLLHSFNQSAKQFNMVITTDKTKCLVSSKESTRCKLENDQKIVEQVNQFNYLGAEITS